ncbi:MAG: LysM peptidoglycan-binding domain-containing protein, partial [Desulfobacterota bacterium]|nr:LysM peptidoglycan-binding domain-containing protein [Thermodesulfobacteriota bacterium]
LIFTPQDKKRWNISFFRRKLPIPISGMAIIILIFLVWFYYADFIKSSLSPKKLPSVTKELSLTDQPKRQIPEKKYSSSSSPPKLSEYSSSKLISPASKTEWLISEIFDTPNSEPSTSATSAESEDSYPNQTQTEIKSEENKKDNKVIVKSGDTLTRIAANHYPNRIILGIKEIIQANPEITNPNLIYPGQVLSLPSAKSNLELQSETNKKTLLKFAIKICTLVNSNQALAEDYIDELKQKGYGAYAITKRTNQGKIIYEIYIGNYETQEEAETIAAIFRKQGKEPEILIKTNNGKTFPDNEEEIK